MAKKSHKRPARSKKDSAGCMSGLISMFDFRQGRFTQKYLSDRKYGSGRHGGAIHSRKKIDVRSNLEEKNEDVSDTDAKVVGRNNSGKASIKALMAEEMSRTHTSQKIPSSRVEQLRSEFGFEYDINDSRASQSTWSDPSESSYFDVNLAELMVEFCRENHKCQEKHIESNGDRKNNCLIEPDGLTQKHDILKKALRDITEALLTQNSVDSKQVTSHGAVQPKEFMDALETLNSNKDTFLKLLQDPNSHLIKHILELQNTQTREISHGSKPEESVNCQLPHKQNRDNYFRKGDRSDGAKPINESSSEALKRIVVLKPVQARHEHYSNTISPISSPKSLHNLLQYEGTERVSSHFSLKEIKRRLRNMIGENKKERNLISMDGILHKIPYGFQNSDENNKTSSSTQKTSKLSALFKRGENDAKLKQHWPQKKANKPTLAHSLDRESVCYEETKKSLAQMVSYDGQNEILSPRKFSKSLGRIPSLPGYNSSSPRFSPGRDKKVDSAAQMRSSPLQKIKQDDSTSSGSSTRSIEHSPCSDNNPDDGPQLINSTPALPKSQLNIGEGLILRDILVEFATDERCNEEGSPMVSDSGPSEEAQPLNPAVSVSPNSILVQKLEAPESTTENLDRPSPVSVLEPFFSEDINCPERVETHHAESTAEPRQLGFEQCGSTVSDKETKLKYVRTVLEASDIICSKLPERLQLSDQLLDPFVFDEVEMLYGQVIDDSKLLFDCINEILIDIRDRYSSCTFWMSFIKPYIRPAPTGENFVHEVCKGVDRHLLTVFPYTLDLVVKKDLEGGNWMNVRLETEAAVIDIGEVILDYIMEETILELWD